MDTYNDNQAVTLLKGNTRYHHIRALGTALTDKITSLSPSDPIITKALAAMNNKKGEPWILHSNKNDWEYVDGALYFKHWLYIPEPACPDLISSLHQFPAGGHEGFFRTLHQMQKDYWWPGMFTFLQNFITGCANCQTAKVNTHPIVPGLSPLAVKSPLPFSSISVDLIMGLPSSHSYDSVMVMVDHGLTKGIIYCPCNKGINIAGVAQLFFTHVFPRFSLHSKVISDRGP